MQNVNFSDLFGNVSYTCHFFYQINLWWFSLGTPVSSTIKTDRHDITEVLLKVALNTITLTPQLNLWWYSPGTPVSSTIKTDRHDVTEILLKVALNTITHNPQFN